MMREILELTRDRINLHDDVFAENHPLDIQHLRKMLGHVCENRLWPTDKRLRWLGFIIGTIDSRVYGLDASSHKRLAEIDVAVLQEPLRNPDHEKIIFSCCRDVIEYLHVNSMSSPKHLVNMLSGASKSLNSNQLSFRLGYCQAYLTYMGLITVREERDRTRPIFHEAYRECGFLVPETI